MTLEQWSVVITGFTGEGRALAQAVPSIFGRDGLDVFGLRSSNDKHLPAEVADNLAADEASHIVMELAGVGAEAFVVPTAQVQEVRHRAAEVWFSRQAGGFGFTEIDGMILASRPLNARENLALARSKGWSGAPWIYERSTNHKHTRMGSSDREHVRDELQLAEYLESALREAYPGHRFVISHIPAYAITFYQATTDDPDLALEDHVRDGKALCSSCQRQQPFVPLLDPDAEFPQARWGRCSVCGDDVLLQVRELLREVAPG